MSDGLRSSLDVLRTNLGSRNRSHVLGTLAIELSPNRVGRFTDAGLFHQFPCHGAHQVLIGIERLQSFAGELSFHHRRDKHLFAHQPQTDLLHRPFVGQKLHAHRMS